ncbi:MAG: hypothetical protein Q8Q02_09215 [Nocardioides sp.]|nr:hypothetical protein [Nocardioides sp.]
MTLHRGCNQHRHRCGQASPSRTPGPDRGFEALADETTAAFLTPLIDRTGRTPHPKREVPDLTGLTFGEARAVRASVQAERAIAAKASRPRGPITDSEWAVAYNEALADQPWPEPGSLYPDNIPEIDLMDW